MDLDLGFDSQVKCQWLDCYIKKKLHLPAQMPTVMFWHHSWFPFCLSWKLECGWWKVSEPVVGSFGTSPHTGTREHACSRISAVSVHGALGRGMRTCMTVSFGMGQGLFFHPRKNKENHHGPVWRTGTFKTILFYQTFLRFRTITDHYHNLCPLCHCLLKRFLYYTCLSLPL